MLDEIGYTSYQRNERRLVRANSELEAAFNHLLYEVDMLMATELAIRTGLFPPGHLLNALLESFVIHARNLLHFLDPLNPAPTDVIAQDFFDDPEIWAQRRGDAPEELAPVRRRANKEVAHLTYERNSIAQDARGWDCHGIALALQQRFQLFLNSIDSELAQVLRINDSAAAG